MGRKIDLTGQKFEKLTVMYECKERKNRNIYWHCRCDCGNEKDIRGADLKNGSTKSCGCYHKEKTSEKNSKDLKGQNFGRLTVIKKTDKRKNGMVVWKCLCECGKEVEVPTSYLTTGDTKSCGCYQKERVNESCKKQLLGLKFGKLTVIEETKERYYKNILWKCKCDCGNIVFIPTSSLTSGSTSSCGCIKSKAEEYINKVLNDNNIQYTYQKSFNTCKFNDTNALAKFDFYINNNFLLEYDGVQHFDKNNEWYSPTNKKHDEYKNDWCKKNNIKLYRISYKENLYERLDFILKENGLI